jgi:hypothetical protein
LTATSARTPAISSLKRIWIGCWISVRLPISGFIRSSMRRRMSSLLLTSAGHSSSGLGMT